MLARVGPPTASMRVPARRGPVYAARVSRSDFYTIVHKHLRRALFDVSVQLSGLDRTNVAKVVDAFRGAAGMLRGHAELENASVAPLLRDTSPALEVAMTSGHAELEAELAGVEARIVRLPALADDELEAAGLDAYRSWNRFVASYLMHLDEEESRLFRALGDANPPASAVAAVVAKRGEQSTAFLAMLLPVLSHAERLEILRPLRSEPDLIERGMAAARDCLTAAQLGVLERALERA